MSLPGTKSNRTDTHQHVTTRGTHLQLKTKCVSSGTEENGGQFSLERDVYLPLLAPWSRERNVGRLYLFTPRRTWESRGAFHHRVERNEASCVWWAVKYGSLSRFHLNRWLWSHRSVPVISNVIWWQALFLVDWWVGGYVVVWEWIKLVLSVLSPYILITLFLSVGWASGGTLLRPDINIVKQDTCKCNFRGLIK